jgi:hypothetical protein
MVTVGDLIKAAFYRAGIRDNSQEIEGDDITRGIETLNLLMHRLEADGLEISWVDVTTANDTLYVLDKHKRAMIYILGMDLLSEYQLEPSQVMAAASADAYSTMLRDAYANAPVLNNVDQLPQTYMYFTITNG